MIWMTPSQHSRIDHDLANLDLSRRDHDRRLRDADEARMNEWQPIETVPFDTLVLIWDGFDVCIANSIRGEWISYGCDGPAVRLMDDFGTSYQEPGAPTHWMMLPAPPMRPE